ncbi:MAG: hypothetical protein GC151_13885 [Betaproteobacteria bacterium]|nr:hypothetical protein [Betaproteobacteria bacterium]
MMQVIGAINNRVVRSQTPSPKLLHWWKCNEGAGTTIADAIGGADITKGASSVTDTVVWGSDGRATFPATAIGWGVSGAGLLGDYDNTAGGSLLIAARVNISQPPQPGTADRTILGYTSAAGYDTFLLRLRALNTPFNAGDDGTLVFGTYPNGGSVQTVQVTSPVPQGDRSVCIARDVHVAALVDGAAQTVSFFYEGIKLATVAQTANMKASKCNAVPTFYLGCANAVAGNTDTVGIFDIQLYASTEAPPASIEAALGLIGRSPFSVLNAEDWP